MPFAFLSLLGKANPNTFSKSLAEQILEKEHANVPLAIVRPSIVTGGFKENSIF